MFMRAVAEMLGFRSPKALQCARAGYDHHKAWQMFSISFEALLCGLSEEFVLTNPDVVNYDQFIEWANHQQSNQFSLVYTICCTYTHWTLN